jgi:hypothetical protein
MRKYTFEHEGAVMVLVDPKTYHKKAIFITKMQGTRNAMKKVCGCDEQRYAELCKEPLQLALTTEWLK